MRLIASELLSIILSPANWILILIILQFIFKKPGLKKKCRLIALGIFLVFSNQWLLNSYAKHWQPAPRDISMDSTYSAAILLGGFGSPIRNEANGYFNSGSDRFIQAVKLYKLGKIQHILIS